MEQFEQEVERSGFKIINKFTDHLRQGSIFDSCNLRYRANLILILCFCAVSTLIFWLLCLWKLGLVQSVSYPAKIGAIMIVVATVPIFTIRCLRCVSGAAGVFVAGYILTVYCNG